MKLTQAHQMGCDAYALGRSSLDNLFNRRVNPNLFKAWNRGWLLGRARSRKLVCAVSRLALARDGAAERGKPNGR